MCLEKNTRSRFNNQHTWGLSYHLMAYCLRTTIKHDKNKIGSKTFEIDMTSYTFANAHKYQANNNNNNNPSILM